MKVYADEEVIKDLENLIDVLFEKGYFSYEESSVFYVVDLFEDILKNLPLKSKKPAPKYFTARFGKGLYYATFPKSKQTQWYAFFKMYEMEREIFYQVRHIENNHTAARYL